MRLAPPSPTPPEPASPDVAGHRRLGAWGAILAAAVLLATSVVLRFGILHATDLEFSLATIGRARDWILGFGWLGPVVFVAIVALRPFLLLSSHVVLTLGGLAFGPWAGRLWGAAGLAISGAYQFGAARWLGDAWVRPRLGSRGLAAERLMRRAGPAVVALVTAHPLGVMTPAYLAAGLVRMSVLGFGVALALATPVRAGLYSMLGASVLEWGPGTSFALAAGLGALTVAPLLSPRARRWIFANDEDSAVPPRATNPTGRRPP